MTEPDRSSQVPGSSSIARPEPVRVLWLIKGLGPGGAERLLVNQARVHDPRAVTLRAAFLVPWKAQLIPELESAGVTATSLDGPREWDPRWAWRLRRLVLDEGIEVVHVHSPYVAALTRVMLRTITRARRPALVCTEHNRWPRHSRLTRTANRLTLGLDDATLAVSEDVRSTMPVRRRGRVEVLVHGVDLELVRSHRGDRAAMRAELGLADDEVAVCTVANFRPEKAYEVMIDAAAIAVGESSRVRFFSVGQGPLEEHMRRHARDRGLDDRFTFLGYREDALSVLAACDVFTLSSRHEGLPVSLMEALALGLPVVATSVGGIPQAVTDGVEALLVPVDRPAELASAYIELARDDRRRSTMAAAAERTGDTFGIEPAERRLEALYWDLASSRRS